MIKPGLERIEKGYRFLNFPSRDIPTLLIGGTNGKGTTAGLLWYLFSMSKVKAGLFTSPHLINYSERVRCSGENITDSELVEYWRSLKGELPEDIYEGLSFFEVTTLLALSVFEKKNCEVNILEVGVGGSWDSTNVTNPIASAVVSVGFDHQGYLGNKLSDIAREKVGILRPGRPFFLGSGGRLYDDFEAKDLLFNSVLKARCPFYRFGDQFGIEGNKLYIQIPGLDSVLINLPEILENAAFFVKENFSLAAAIYHWFRDYSIKNQLDVTPLPLEAVLDSFSSKETPLPPCMAGRFQKISVTSSDGEAKNLLVDVCHNVDGTLELRRNLDVELRKLNLQKVPGMVSILKDKDLNEMLDVLKGILDPIMLFRIDSERTLRVSDLAPRHRDLKIFDSFSDLWEEMGKFKEFQSMPHVICGSVMAVGKVFEYFSEYPKTIETESILEERWNFGHNDDHGSFLR